MKNLPMIAGVSRLPRAASVDVPPSLVEALPVASAREVVAGALLVVQPLLSSDCSREMDLFGGQKLGGVSASS